MRGFLQERAAAVLPIGTSLGKALFYFGCRDPIHDYLYANELANYEQQGIVDMRPCFSRKSEASRGFKYVHERIWDERKELKELFDAGAKVFLCGSAGKLAGSVGKTVREIYREVKGCGEEEAREWFEKVGVERFVADVYD